MARSHRRWVFEESFSDICRSGFGALKRRHPDLDGKVKNRKRQHWVESSEPRRIVTQTRQRHLDRERDQQGAGPDNRLSRARPDDGSNEAHHRHTMESPAELNVGVVAASAEQAHAGEEELNDHPTGDDQRDPLVDTTGRFLGGVALVVEGPMNRVCS